MNYAYILFFVKILFLISFVYTQSICEDLVKYNSQENELITTFKKEIESFVLDEQCVEKLLRHGFYRASEVILEEQTKRKIKFREKLVNSISSITKDLDNIYNKFSFDSSEYQEVSPAFMWAQSLENIYLLIKFGHRHDAPGCLEIKNEEVLINKNILTFKGFCIQGDVPIKLDLHLDMFDEVLPEESNWSKSSVGRFQITMKKKKAPHFWKNLCKDGSKIPSNMKVWFDMKAKFETELKSYYEAEEDEIESTSNDSKKSEL